MIPDPPGPMTRELYLIFWKMESRLGDVSKQIKTGRELGVGASDVPDRKKEMSEYETNLVACDHRTSILFERFLMLRRRGASWSFLGENVPSFCGSRIFVWRVLTQ